MTLDDATQEYSHGERKRILGMAAKFNATVDITIEKLEKQIEDIYNAQAELYTLSEEKVLDEAAFSELANRFVKLGVKPAYDVSRQQYY